MTIELTAEKLAELPKLLKPKKATIKGLETQLALIQRAVAARDRRIAALQESAHRAQKRFADILDIRENRIDYLEGLISDRAIPNPPVTVNAGLTGILVCWRFEKMVFIERHDRNGVIISAIPTKNALALADAIMGERWRPHREDELPPLKVEEPDEAEEDDDEMS